jgi:hypothetical protein
MSEWHNFILTDYNVDVLKNGFMLTCNGQLPGASMVYSSNQINGTFDQCIEKFKSIHGYEVEIIPPIDKQLLKEIDPSGKTSEYREKVFSKTNEESDHRFITRLIEDVTRSGDQKGGYRVSFVTKNGVDTLQAVLPEQAGSIATYKYIVQDKNSVVLDWKPTVDFSAVAAIMGKDEVVVNGTQLMTGRSIKQRITQELSQPFQSVLEGKDVNQNVEAEPPKPPATEMIFYNHETMPTNVTSRGVRVHRGYTMNSTTDISKKLNDHLRQALTGQQASLVVLGDPRIVACSHCEVIFRYPNTLKNPAAIPPLHYTSGKYFVEEVTHELIGGNYRVVFKLCRASGTKP